MRLPIEDYVQKDVGVQEDNHRYLRAKAR